MRKQKLEGLIAAPFTPMLADGSLNLSIIPEYYALLRQNGVSGAFICGSTGEGVSLTTSEKIKVAEAWAKAAGTDSSFKIITLLGGTCLADAKELAAHAAANGLYAVAFTAPSYFKPASVEMLAACCADVAAAAPELPFYYYHIPVLTGVGFAMYDLIRQVHGLIPNFAGIKYTHEDFMDFQSCLSFAGGEYDMLWGRDENMLPALSLGAKGSVGSTFNYAAPLYLKLIHAFENGDLKAATGYQQMAINMIRLLGKYGGIATGKSYMRLIGLDCGGFRLPVRNMLADDFQRFQKDVEELGFHQYKSTLPEKITG